METYYVDEDDIYVIRLRRDRVEHTLEREPCILVDVDAEGKALKIEIVGASSTTPQQLFAVLQEFGLDIRPAEQVA